MFSTSQMMQSKPHLWHVFLRFAWKLAIIVQEKHQHHSFALNLYRCYWARVVSLCWTLQDCRFLSLAFKWNDIVNMAESIDLMLWGERLFCWQDSLRTCLNSMQCSPKGKSWAGVTQSEECLTWIFISWGGFFFFFIILVSWRRQRWKSLWKLDLLLDDRERSEQSLDERMILREKKRQLGLIYQLSKH